MFAVDNRCPHMGFPLDRGTCGDGILTCHWHHASFDLASALLREDRDFHTLIAAARYLAAHCPTSRAELQTYRMALRLARGERLFDDEQVDGEPL